MSIKTVVFAKNANGLTSMQINTQTQTIVSGGAALAHLTGRHYRLIGRGKLIEYRDGDKYCAIPAEIREIN